MCLYSFHILNTFTVFLEAILFHFIYFFCSLYIKYTKLYLFLFYSIPNTWYFIFISYFFLNSFEMLYMYAILYHFLFVQFLHTLHCLIVFKRHTLSFLLHSTCIMINILYYSLFSQYLLYFTQLMYNIYLITILCLLFIWTLYCSLFLIY